MAKTRSQSRNQTKIPTQSLKVSFKRDTKPKKKTQNRPKMKDCFIRLDRIDPARIESLSVPNKYNLRKQASSKTERKKLIPSTSIKPSIIATTVALSQSALHTSRAARMWEKLKKQISNVTLNIDDLVCARMSGHRPWPAKIIEFKRNGTLLFFLGTNEKGTVKRNEIIPYEFCKHIIMEYLKVPTHGLCSKTQMYHLSYLKATREISCIHHV